MTSQPHQSSEISRLHGRVDEVERAPCQIQRMFGDPFLLEAIYIRRTDDNHQILHSRSSQLPEACSSTTPELPLIAIVHGVTGIGKTTLAKRLCTVEMKRHDRFDHVGYFNALDKKPKQIYSSFYQHFLAVKDRTWKTHLPIPEAARQRRILLVIDDCENWEVVVPFLRLDPRSHIVVTTQRLDLVPDGFVGIVQRSLGPMNRENATALLLQHASDCPPNLQQQIFDYSQGYPSAVVLLAEIFNEEGPSTIEKLASGQSADFHFRFDSLIGRSIQRIGTSVEIDLFCALSHFRDWNPLPYSFILECWEWITQEVQLKWSNAHSQRLLSVLAERGLVSITRREDTGRFPVCTLLYPDPFKVVTLRRTIWDYCSNHQSIISMKVRELVSDRLSAIALSGKYNFLLLFVPELPDNPVLKFLVQIHKAEAALSGLDDGFESYICFEYIQHIPSYLSNLSKEDLPEIFFWTLRCLKSHLRKSLQKPELNPKLFESRCQLLDCVCLSWAQTTIRWFLTTPPFTCFDEIRRFLNKLLRCPNFWSSQAVQILNWFLPSPELTSDIFDYLQDQPVALTEFCDSLPKQLTALIYNFCIEPREDFDTQLVFPRFYDSVALLLLEEEFKYPLITKHSFWRPILTARQQGQLSNTTFEALLSRAWDWADTKSRISYVSDWVSVLQLPSTHWIHRKLKESQSDRASDRFGSSPNFSSEWSSSCFGQIE